MHTNKFVYFARRRDGTGPIKIGISRIPEYRIHRMSRDLEVLVEYPGLDFVERQFHNLFRDQHEGHEWFTATDDLLAVIAAIKVGKFDPSVLPANPVLLTRKRGEYSAERRAAIGERTRAAIARKKQAA